MNDRPMALRAAQAAAACGTDLPTRFILPLLGAYHDAVEQAKRAESCIRGQEVMMAGLDPLCPCDPNPATTDGPQQECPIHGDGDTFVAYVRELELHAGSHGEHVLGLDHE